MFERSHTQAMECTRKLRYCHSILCVLNINSSKTDTKKIMILTQKVRMGGVQVYVNPY